MKKSAYRASRDEMTTEYDALREKWLRLSDEAGARFNEALAFDWGSPEWQPVYDEYTKACARRDAVRAEMDQIRAKRDALDESVKNGFEYERPGSRLINRLLLRAPEGTMEIVLKDDNVVPKYPRIAASILGLLFSGSFAWALWVTTIQLISALHGVGPADAAFAGFVLALVMLGSGALVMAVGAYSPAANVRRLVNGSLQRFVRGAENWNWLQRLLAASLHCIFGVTLLGYVEMAVYLWRMKRGATQAEALAAAAYFASTVTRVYVGMSCFAIFLFAYAVLRSITG